MPRPIPTPTHALRIALVALIPATVGLVRPAAALTFDFTTIPGDSLTSNEAAAFTTAANAWSSYLIDPFTVNLQIGFANLGAGILGSTSPTLYSFNAAGVKALLTADETSVNDHTAVASLPTFSPAANLLMTSAEAKAIGLIYNGATDGSIQFSSNFAFSTSRDSNGNIAAGTFDLIGIAEHEIGHALGFFSSLDTNSTQPSLLDEFRYAAVNSSSLANGASAYFSIDNGTTDLAQFSQGGTGNYQASHWLQGTLSGTGTALMNPALAPGAVQNIQPIDLIALDVIGYDLATPVLVPEPASAAMLALGLLALHTARRRRDRA